MAREPSPDEAAYVVIRHINSWSHNYHTPAFLRPLVCGTLRRLAVPATKKG